MSKKISFIDRMLSKLPKIHIRGYKYCGPNTDLTRGDPCINKLDCACMKHDFAYAESNDLKLRCNADKILFLKAIQRVYAKDSQIGERFAAMFVSMIICIKLYLGRIELYITIIGKYLANKFRKIIQRREVKKL